jgi:hypothetical protein
MESPRSEWAPADNAINHNPSNATRDSATIITACSQLMASADNSEEVSPEFFRKARWCLPGRSAHWILFPTANTVNMCRVCEKFEFKTPYLSNGFKAIENSDTVALHGVSARMKKLHRR